MEPANYSASHEHNRRAWDSRVRQQERFTRPADDKDFVDPLATVDGWGWLGGDIRGKQLLCLAAGGGRQSALYAAAGAVVTVVDFSPGMLELDRQVAAERGLHLRTVEASMDDLSCLNPGEFDVVIQPVSTCYVPRIDLVYQQVARVMRIGGIYISQHKQPASLQADPKTSKHGYELTEPYYRQGPLPNVQGSRHREEGTIEYLHRWEELLGHLCRSGFVLEDLVEPLHANHQADSGSFEHRSCYLAPYVRFKARRVAGSSEEQSSAQEILVS
ncbi:MAG TPA: class I SAM-dependent methyltransferase [Planctomycetaceae bacterium]|nr:class I SAM-dependent methyltransferase [Planctomycetaceae bacterium]